MAWARNQKVAKQVEFQEKKLKEKKKKEQRKKASENGGWQWQAWKGELLRGLSSRVASATPWLITEFPDSLDLNPDSYEISELGNRDLYVISQN